MLSADIPEKLYQLVPQTAEAAGGTLSTNINLNFKLIPNEGIDNYNIARSLTKKKLSFCSFTNFLEYAKQWRPQGGMAVSEYNAQMPAI